MDYAQFLKNLPKLYEGWNTDEVRPKATKFDEILGRVSGLTRPSVLQLLNSAVGALEPGEIYCEVGSYRGATLIGALLGHEQATAYAVDNFSEFDETGEGFATLQENLEGFDMSGRIEFVNDDFERVFGQATKQTPRNPIGVYFYDGAHDYRSQLIGLLFARPFLANRALIVVDDSNWEAVTQANRDFVAIEPRCKLELEFPTPHNAHATFWNGIEVLSWDEDRHDRTP
jgi:hypothetical protein